MSATAVPPAWRSPTPRPASACPSEVIRGLGRGPLIASIAGAALAVGAYVVATRRGYHWNQEELLAFHAAIALGILIAIVGVLLRIRAGSRAKALFVHGEPQPARVLRVVQLARKRAGQHDAQAVTTGWDVDVELSDGRKARFFGINRKPRGDLTVFVVPGRDQAALVLIDLPGPVPAPAQVRFGTLKA